MAMPVSVSRLPDAGLAFTVNENGILTSIYHGWIELKAHWNDYVTQSGELK